MCHFKMWKNLFFVKLFCYFYMGQVVVVVLCSYISRCHSSYYSYYVLDIPVLVKCFVFLEMTNSLRQQTLFFLCLLCLKNVCNSKLYQQAKLCKYISPAVSCFYQSIAQHAHCLSCRTHRHHLVDFPGNQPTGCKVLMT